MTKPLDLIELRRVAAAELSRRTTLSNADAYGLLDRANDNLAVALKAAELGAQWNIEPRHLISGAKEIEKLGRGVR